MLISDIHLIHPDGYDLFSIKHFRLDIDMKKTFRLKPSISSLSIESPSTFLEKDKNGTFFTLPSYIETTAKNSTNIDLLNLPFSIDNIEITKGKIELKEQTTYRSLITDLAVVIPGFSLLNNIAIKPVIKGRFKNKDFEFTGKTQILNDSIINEFDLEFTKLKIKDIAEYVPAIKKVKLVSGTLTSKVRLVFTSFKHKKATFIISGSADVYNLYLKDNNNGKIFLKNSNLTVDTFVFNAFEKTLDISVIEFKKGALSLIKSKTTNQTSTFFNKSNNKKGNYRFNLREIKAQTLNTTFHDLDNTTKYYFYNSYILIKNFTNTTNTGATYYIKSKATGLAALEAEGQFNHRAKSFSCANITIEKLSLTNFNSIKNRIPWLSDATLTKFKGGLSLAPGHFSIEGSAHTSSIKLHLKKSDSDITIDTLNITDASFNSNDMKINFSEIACTTMHYPVNNNLTVDELDFTIPAKNDKYTITVIKNKDTLAFEFDTAITIDTLRSQFNKNRKNIYLTIDEIRRVPELTITALPAFQITSKGTFHTKGITLSTNTGDGADIPNLETEIELFSLNPFKLTIKTIDIHEPSFSLLYSNKRKLLLFDIFEIKSRKNNDDKTQIDVDKTQINNGTFIFKDHSLENEFNIHVNDINGTISHYPSTIYPEGTIRITGLVNNRNNMDLNVTVGQEKGIVGNIKSSLIALPQFSTYMEHFLSHTITSGNLDIDTTFSYKQNYLSLKLNLLFKDFMVLKNTKKKTGRDLSLWVSLLEDNDGKIVMDLPAIEGEWGNPKIDYLKIFFDLFLTRLSNTGKLFLATYNNFKPDEQIEIVYFKPGTAIPVSDVKSLFSKDFARHAADPDKHFVIEGYVDLSRDFKTPPDDKALYALSYARIMKIKKILIEDFTIDSKRIGITEKSITENPYIEGIGNSIGVVKSGIIKK